MAFQIHRQAAQQQPGLQGLQLRSPGHGTPCPPCNGFRLRHRAPASAHARTPLRGFNGRIEKEAVAHHHLLFPALQARWHRGFPQTAGGKPCRAPHVPMSQYTTLRVSFKEKQGILRPRPDTAKRCRREQAASAGHFRQGRVRTLRVISMTTLPAVRRLQYAEAVQILPRFLTAGHRTRTALR